MSTATDGTKISLGTEQPASSSSTYSDQTGTSLCSNVTIDEQRWLTIEHAAMSREDTKGPYRWLEHAAMAKEDTKGTSPPTGTPTTRPLNRLEQQLQERFQRLVPPNPNMSTNLPQTGPKTLDIPLETTPLLPPQPGPQQPQPLVPEPTPQSQPQMNQQPQPQVLQQPNSHHVCTNKDDYNHHIKTETCQTHRGYDIIHSLEIANNCDCLAKFALSTGIQDSRFK